MLGLSLRAVIFEDGDALSGTGLAQPGLFAVEVALLELLRSWGITPDVVAGHSLGEITAAYAAGVFELADAATLVAARGRLMQALPAGGTMLALGAGEAEGQGLLAEAGLRLDIAAVNGPASVVLSGSEAEIVRAGELAAGRGWKPPGCGPATPSTRC